jgi:CheY-like chemotaxis protein/predicted regulator of Ras-like GTPase activity (Roadblock/LC7/MglB family)
LRHILGQDGYAVETAQTAEEALEVLPQIPFSLVITDLQMPGMDGLELLAQIKRSSPETPVVMITAHGSMDTVIQALRHGVNDFVNKPFKPADLLNIVHRESKSPEAVAPSSPAAVLGLQLSARQMDRIDQHLAEMRLETGARCVLLIEGNGYLISAKGVIEDINVSALATLVAGDFAATAGIASVIGEQDAFRLNYHEGEQYSVYSAQVAPDVFMLVIFGQEIKLGSVLYYARNILPKLQGIFKRVESSPPDETAPPRAPESAPTEVASAPPAELEASTPAEEELFSLDDVMESGLLEEDLLANLETQFASMWVSDFGD